MLDIKYVPKKGCERLYDVAISEKEQFETELEIAKQKAIEEVESRFAEKKSIIDAIIDKVVDIVEVEIPTETTEATASIASILEATDENQIY